MPRTTHRIAVIDVETTGFSASDRIIEIGIVTFDTEGNEENRFETLVQPDRGVPNSVIHGITPTMLKDARLFHEVAGRIASLLDDHVVVAHNASFDTRMLNQEFSRLGHTLTGLSIWSVDTMRLSKFLLPGAPGNLADALATVGIVNESAHTALADAVATAELFYDLLSRGAMIVAHPLVMPAGALQLESGAHLPRPVPTGQPETDAYQQVLIAALDDGVVSDAELQYLVNKAAALGLTSEEAHDIHLSMIRRMAVSAWADGVLTEGESQLIRDAATSLQVDQSAVNSLLRAPDETPELTLVAGTRLSFTGELDLPRETWKARVTSLGFTVGGVTKNCAALVSADPHSRSGKAKKAREYGVPIITESQLAVLLHQPTEDLSQAHWTDEIDSEDVLEDELNSIFPWFAEPSNDTRDVVGRWISDFPTFPLVRMSPRLSEATVPETLDRGRVAVARWLTHHPRPLTASADDLRDINGIGTKSLSDLVHSVVVAAVDGTDANEDYVLSPDLYAEEESHDDPGAVSATPAAPAQSTDADRIAEWFALCHRTVMPFIDAAPDEIKLAAQRIDDNSEATRRRLAEKAAETLREVVRSDDRFFDITSRRLLSDSPETLDDIGQHWGVTRERIRQLEKQLRTRLREPLAPHISAFSHRVPRPMREADLLERSPDLATSVFPDLALVDFLLAFSDDVVRRAGWIETATAHVSLEDTSINYASPYGVIAWEVFDDHGPEDNDERSAWISSVMNNWVIRDGHVFTKTGGSADRAAAVLSVKQTPMTAEELIEFIGRGSSRSMDNALSIDERVHRIGRGTWALVEWGNEEYTTVSDFISKRVDADGSYPLGQLLEEAEQLGIAETTIRTYCSNGEFIIDSGLVTRNENEVVAEANPEEHAGMFVRDGTWQLLITVNHDHLRGSGFSVPRSLAGLFDVPFLGKKVFSSELGEQELTYGRTNATTGTIRRFLQQLSSQEGDRLWIRFSEDGTFAVEPATDYSPAEGLASLLNYCGMDDRGDDLATLNAALGLDPDAPRRRTVSRFNHRREEELAEVVRNL